jgi:hypothetical protein
MRRQLFYEMMTCSLSLYLRPCGHSPTQTISGQRMFLKRKKKKKKERKEE